MLINDEVIFNDKLKGASVLPLLLARRQARHLI